MRFAKFLTSLLFLVVATVSVTAQAGLPALIIDGSGSFAVLNKSGDEIDAHAGTSLLQGSTLLLKQGARVTVLLRDQFTIYDSPGEYILEDMDDSDDLFGLNFDPVFAEYVKASMAAVDHHIGSGLWPVKLDQDDGDGWGATGSGSSKGWGASGAGSDKGWGASGSGSSKGWGASGSGSSKGWGKSQSIAGWGSGIVRGKKKKRSRRGWGASGSGSSKGWGISNRYDPKSGWASMYRVTSSGWGASGSGSSKGWGKTNPTSAKGWGASGSGSSKGWGASGSGSSKGWGREDMSIGLSQPGGYYPPTQTHLAWDAVKKSDRYLFVIYDLSNTVIYKQVVSEPNLMVPFGNIPQEVSLYYQVYAEGRRAISPPTFFKVMDADDYADSQATYLNSAIYDLASNYVQDLMRVISYEHDERFLDCIRLYASMRSTYPSNQLVKFCYAGFLSRQGLDASIEEVFD